MKPIEEIIKLTPWQEELCKMFETLYKKMEEAGIALAVNDDGYVVAYNSKEVEDCVCTFDPFEKEYELADINNMRALFPVWGCDILGLKRKK